MTREDGKSNKQVNKNGQTNRYLQNAERTWGYPSSQRRTRKKERKEINNRKRKFTPSGRILYK